MAVIFIGGGNRKDLVKTTDLSQVTDKLYQIMLYTSSWSRSELTTSVVIDTDCIGRCKSNYHTITATTAPISFLVRWVCFFINFLSPNFIGKIRDLKDACKKIYYLTLKISAWNSGTMWRKLKIFWFFYVKNNLIFVTCEKNSG